MRRGRPLRADPSKTAAWQQRGRSKGLARDKGLKAREKPLERRAKLQAPAPRPRVATPPDVWAAVLRRDRKQCVWCRHAGRVGPAEHPHHLLPKQSWPELAGVVENVVALCASCHMTHEFSPRDRLPWDALPRACRAFLRERSAVSGRAARLVSVKYPAGAAQPERRSRRT